MTTFNCPACGAPLKIRPGKVNYKCEYCDSEVSVAGSSNGKQIPEDTGLVAQVLRELVKPVEEFDGNVKKLSFVSKELVKEESHLEMFKYPRACMFQFMLPSADLLLLIAYIMSGEATAKGIIGNIIFMIVSFAIACRITAGRHNDLTKKVAELEIEEQNLMERNIELTGTYDFSLVPEELCHGTFITYMAESLETNRAYDLKQAIAQCREEKRRCEEKIRNDRKIAELENHLASIEQQNRAISNKLDSRVSSSRNGIDIDNDFATGLAVVAGLKALKKFKDWMD